MFVEEMYVKFRLNKLLGAIKIHPNEVTDDTLVSCINGRLVLYHVSYAKMHHVKEITSEFTDYEVKSLYGCKPSAYDQQLYINIMSEIFKEKKYYDKARRYWREQDKNALKCDENEDDGNEDSI